MSAPTIQSKDEIPDAAYRKMVLTLMDKQAGREVEKRRARVRGAVLRP